MVKKKTQKTIPQGSWPWPPKTKQKSSGVLGSKKKKYNFYRVLWDSQARTFQELFCCFWRPGSGPLSFFCFWQSSFITYLYSSYLIWMKCWKNGIFKNTIKQGPLFRNFLFLCGNYCNSNSILCLCVFCLHFGMLADHDLAAGTPNNFAWHLDKIATMLETFQYHSFNAVFCRCCGIADTWHATAVQGNKKQ